MNLVKFYFWDTPNYSDKFPAILLYLLPVALVTGPFFADLFLSLIGLYFLIISLNKKLFSYYKNPFVYIFACFYFYIILRSLFSVEIYYSLQGCLFYFRYLFFSLAVFYLFNNISNLARNLGLSIFLTLLIVGLDGYYQWVFGYNILGWYAEEGNYDRLAGFFRDEKILGGYLARLTPVGLGLLLFSLKMTKTKEGKVENKKQEPFSASMIAQDPSLSQEISDVIKAGIFSDESGVRVVSHDEDSD